MKEDPCLAAALTGLLERISNVLRGLPGAVQLYLFGSAADPDLRDGYSDLDLQIITEQFVESKTCLLPVLERQARLSLLICCKIQKMIWHTRWHCLMKAFTTNCILASAAWAALPEAFP